LTVRAGGVLLVLFGLAAGATCVWLGLWQLGRAAEKREAHVARLALFDEPTLDLGETLPDDSPQVGRRVRLRGYWDRERHVLLSGRVHLSMAGVVLVTPIVLGSGERVLVERGWLEAADSRTAHPERLADSTAAVTGVVAALAARAGAFEWTALAAERPGVTLWSARALDSAQVAARVPAPVARWYVRQLPDPAAAASPGGPLPLAARESASGESVHQAYALQWFALAILAAGGALALALRRRPAAAA
jgi:cytochrome oxidase assembly protein ShyY1